MSQSRRSFLAMLGLAPFAAPALAASAPDTIGMARGEWGARLVAGSVSRVRGMRRVLIADEIDHWPGLPQPSEATELGRRHDAVIADMHPDHAAHPASGSTSILAACPVVIDDAGGGP